MTPSPPLLGRRLASLALAAVLVGASACPAAPLADAVAHPALWPAAASPPAITDARTEAFITALMAQMSLEEKVGQTIQADIDSISPEDLRRYPLGSILAGGSSGPWGDDRAPAQKWVELARAFRAVAGEPRPGHTPIPLLFGIDAVHGHNNIIGATLFPHNVGLGAARDPTLIRRIGEATAQEVAVTGADWTFGPTLAVPRDVRWGRAYEGYAEDPEVSVAYAGPMTLGLQGELRPGEPLAADHIVGSAKHFLADGGTLGGRDQGDARISEADLIAYHAQAYPRAIDAGILTVMASFSSWNGVKHIANPSLLTGVLKGRMGFQGFVVGDWNAHGEVPGCTTTDCPAAINAGLDMYMAPDSWKGLFDNTLAEVRSGRIPMRRLDDAVRRILRVKVKAGLFDRQRPLEGRYELLGSPEHRALARQAVRESLVLLKNNGGVLPIRVSAQVLVAGDGADDIGKQSGGWTISWQGTGNTNADFPHGQSIWSGIAEAVKAGGGHAELAVDGRFKTRPDVAIVVFGENPYAEFQGDIPTVEYQPGGKRDLALLRSLKAQHIPVVSVFLSGRPLWTNPEINASDAFVAAWLPGTEGGGVADLLIRRPDGTAANDFTGRLSFSWPKRVDQVPLDHGQPGYDPQFAYGYGLSYAHGAVVGPLSENPGRRDGAPNLDRYFMDGHAPEPWSLGTEGAVSLRAIDAGAQENAREARWSGNGAGVVEIAGPPADLSRQANGDMAVLVRYRVDAAPSAPVSLSLACGPGCGGAADVTALLSASPPGQWRTAEVKLACFRAAGADMGRITSPFRLTTAGRLTLAFSEIRLTANEGDAICPGAR
ncbi:MAG: exo 1,3/1,4-beta-D-glucan glucohydrolase [Caulobacteraceae bacterium]|nr:exo 1,3/1,4-beta-D-glucan glucohydrolase [Caulobacteraceae bacterium]